MAKRVSSRSIKNQRQYTYEEAANVLGVSVQTVRGWRKVGLPVLDGQKPHLIIGEVLKGFLDHKYAKSGRTLAIDEFLCMRCRRPRRALGAMIDYKSHTPSRGLLSALCEVCEGPCTKFAGYADLPNLSNFLDIEIRNARDD